MGGVIVARERVAYIIVKVKDGERELEIPWSLNGYKEGVFGLWKRIQADGGLMDDSVMYPAHSVSRFELRWLETED